MTKQDKTEKPQEKPRNSFTSMGDTRAETFDERLDEIIREGILPRHYDDLSDFFDKSENEIEFVGRTFKAYRGGIEYHFIREDTELFLANSSLSDDEIRKFHRFVLIPENCCNEGIYEFYMRK
jgi:hypothetical protein